MGWILLLLLLALLVGGAVILRRSDWRRRWVTAPLFRHFKRILPPLSRTEQEAMAAGSVWWDGELFSGRPDWSRLLAYPKPALTAEEQAFIDDKVSRLLDMVSDFDCITGAKDLSPEVWDYLRTQGFFALIIPTRYGGLGFSSLANSTIVARIASRSLSAAVTVMVPNSLGPAELLLHYGTEAQKDDWLPRLASGEAIPCFALTGLEAGSDAGAMSDQGIVCRGEWRGESIIGIRLNWDKRYITLAPCATVLGLAFKLSDPDHLMGEQTDYGITCALIPTDLAGVETGVRHYPMGQAFLNGPTRGTDVFIPLDWIIGGWAYAGKGWGMLVESLSAGRGISLPALGTACGHLATLTTSAYATVRRQFGLPIGRFEGVQEALARIAGLTYQMEAARRLTTTGLDMGERPGIITAIAKYHMTELARQVLNDAMDVHAGRGLQWGPHNYLAFHYTGIPIAITVEGANILTRNLMIFGQGAIRCHPFVLAELEAAGETDEEQAVSRFDGLLLRHMAFTGRNLLLALGSGLTLGRLERTPVSGASAGYYRQLTRMSRALALCSDVAMLTLGGSLKRREMLSARLGDVLSQLYLASATLKMFEDEGRPAAELPLLHYALQRALAQIGAALQGVFDNLPNRLLGWWLARLIFPLGMHYRGARDRVQQQICRDIMQPGAMRERLTQLCYWRPEDSDAVGQVELAFRALVATQPLEERLQQAQKAGQLPAHASLSSVLEQAEAQAILTPAEAEQLRQAERMRIAALQVDEFAPGELERLGQ